MLIDKQLKNTMAEHGAHITSANVSARPTIFEVMAQESLMDVVRPALKHAVKIVAENRPANFGWLLRFFDELYTCMDFIIQNYHLSKYSASFAENFYDLKRVPTGTSSGKLFPRHHWRSVFLLVAVPYLKTKLDQLFEDLRHRYGSTGPVQSTPIGRLIRTYLSLYPYVHTTWEGTCLAFQLSYMLSQGRWHSPLLKLSGTELRYRSPSDLELEGHMAGGNGDISSTTTLGVVVKKSVAVAAAMLSSGLSAGMFFLQFLDWWYASDSKATSLTALPIPDPPTVAAGDRGLSALLCPLCGRARTNHSVLSVSGYVFCYPCIHGYLQQHKQCPVTGYPASSDHLVKLYIAES